MNIDMHTTMIENYAVIEEGSVVKEIKGKKIDHIVTVNGVVAHTIDVGTIAVCRLRSIPGYMADLGYKVGQLVAHTHIGKQEFKHELLNDPIILIPTKSIIGVVTLKGEDEVEEGMMYEVFMPASDTKEAKRIIEESINGWGQGDWSDGRERTVLSGLNGKALVFP